ncbi:MAG: nucleotidyltransferase domain-containing protein [Oscillospiraceae bacterium]|nr:nucleotidyltransferase domain-containing protein [Oscillospiraceae bacterium]
MKNENHINDKLVRWIEDKVKTKYPDDISMVLIYGSYVNGTANAMSDVDCYYIPKTERGYEIAVDFIIGGVGYDIFPMSWDRVENIAALKEVLLPCVGDVKIIYCNSDEDLERFRQLQIKMQNNLKDADYIRTIIGEKFSFACDLYSKMTVHTDIAAVRKFAGYIIMTLADIVALYNHDYFHFGLKKQLEDLQTKFPDIPKEFTDKYIRVIQSSDNASCKEHCYGLLKITADYTGLDMKIREAELKKSVRENVQPDFQWLAGLYEEISSTFNKIYVCCENGNYALAFLSAVCLQNELDDAMECGGKKYNLLDAYSHTELIRLADRAKEIETDYVQMVLDGGGKIKRFDSFEDFVKADL